MTDLTNQIEKVTQINNTRRYNLIYVFRINDTEHLGCLKIGKATAPDLPLSDLQKDNCKQLNLAARQRIDSYTSTAGVVYELLYTTLAVRTNADGVLESFMDKSVHNVLMRSGYKKKTFHTSKKQTEWFVCDLDIAIKAIEAVKAGQVSLDPYDTKKYKDPIIFRPEQSDAIDRTVKHFKKGNKSMLWNAKMRFGKTLSTMEVVKRLNLTRSLIITHRPVVADGWYEDFGNIFVESDSLYKYGSRTKGETIETLEKLAEQGKCHYIYFASMQDLRGSKHVGGKFAKNEAIFKINWDLVIVDEAHEGTQTTLAQDVFSGICKPSTHILGLSGTPFNLLNKYSGEEIYTWDYVMEQKAKKDWDEIHEGDPNPYDGLPQLKIYTYDLKRIIKEATFSEDHGEAFNFHEFFRTWTGDPKIDGRKKMPITSKVGDFVHEDDVRNFLNLLTDEKTNSNYPFSTQLYRDYFRHTFWIVPGVKEGAALTEMLRSHPAFSAFEVVNVAGNEENDDALDAVREAITDNPDETYTITISCGKLTTGVNVPAWTAVLYLAGSFSTAASTYMQTIFRIQTPASFNGKTKEECYVFDFAPDRTLKVIAEAAKVSAKAGKTTNSDRVIMGEFLNFCPIISVAESTMEPFDVDSMLQKLKQVYVDRVVSTGFEDVSIYNDELLKLNDIDLEAFNKLKKIIGQTKASPKSNEIDINNQGFTDEEYEAVEKAASKKRKNEELTEEEKQLLEEAKEKKKNRDTAISILRGISIRIPLLIYGANIPFDEDLTIDNFTDDDIIDEKSWEEFMPKGVTKDVFKEFKKYYDQDIFIAAGNKIRRLAKLADEYDPTERIKRIADIFSYFRNPDKETVLTPWRVVNMHMSDCLGGYDFYDETHQKLLEEPRFVNQGKVTEEVFNPTTHILEINSKTGLYPLYVAYSTFRAKCNAIKMSGVEALTKEQEQEIWYKTIAENIFVICKTTMAKSITHRTLLGYNSKKDNLHAFEDLLNQVQNNKESFIKNITRPNFWNIKKQNDMLKFNAIVGNPPYQVMDGGAGASAVPVYHKFVNIAKAMRPSYISIIMPSRWMTGGRGLEEFRDKMIADTQISKIYDHYDATDCFENVEIKGGICYFLWDKNHTGTSTIKTFSNGNIQESCRFLKEENCDIFIRDSQLIQILRKVRNFGEPGFDTIVSSMKPYGLRGDFFKNQTKYGLPKIRKTKLEGDITIIGLDESLHRCNRYIPSDYPLPQRDLIDKIKIFAPRNYGSGKMGDLPSNLEFAGPNFVCTETFVQIGPFNNMEEAHNCEAYMRTKLFTILVGIRKQDQGAGKSVYQYAPLQDFSQVWTDEMLYSKYNISEEEQKYIDKILAWSR
ncbi:MAG: Eco57I restriction-modification methylase domain-containing protein [Bacteroidaceae bacterium]|nr:Eco57I restriction-modification methylase domain-containing protein [Bacteroidaceae bacterium]